MKRMLTLLLLLPLLLSAVPNALAEDEYTIDLSTESSTVMVEQTYVEVTCPLNEEAEVIVSVWDESGNLNYQRSYGVCSGWFRSEDIYLRLSGSSTRYQISLQAGSQSYDVEVVRCMPRLTGNAACSVGYPLDNLNDRDSWQSVTLLDVSALNGSSQTVALHASGAYKLGSVTFSVKNGKLSVSAELDSGVDGTIDGAKVYVARNAAEAEALGTRLFTGLTGGLNQSLDLAEAEYVAVLVQLTVSFDPNGVPGSPRVELDGQGSLWKKMQEVTALEAVG